MTPLQLDVPSGPTRPRALSPRQAAVLRAAVKAYVGGGAPVGSKTISHLLPAPLSPATIRTTLAQLTQMGLVEKPHTSSGRIPTEHGLRVFVDHLVDPEELAAYEKRTIAFGVDEAQPTAVANVASQLLSERTRQLGFVVTPRLERVVLQHVSLVRLSSEQLLVVVVSQSGSTYRRAIEDEWSMDQAELDAVATQLNERVVGHTLGDVRDRLAQEAELLRGQTNRLQVRVVQVGSRALAPQGDDPVDLVIETRLALLDQPEFQDPRRVRDLFEALETKERLLEVLDRMLEEDGVQVAFGEEVDEPGLRRCALVATGYGEAGEGRDAPLGVLGVIGPSRMDVSRVIPLEHYVSKVVTEKLTS